MTSYPGETNGLIDAKAYHESVTHNIKRWVPWTEPGLKVVRLRLLSDPGFPFWDVSYCHGYIGDEPVRVQLPFGQLPKRQYRRAIVSHAIRDGVHAQRLGVLDNISTLI
jgi:hypothetical protein